MEPADTQNSGALIAVATPAEARPARPPRKLRGGGGKTFGLAGLPLGRLPTLESYGVERGTAAAVASTLWSLRCVFVNSCSLTKTPPNINSGGEICLPLYRQTGLSVRDSCRISANTAAYIAATNSTKISVERSVRAMQQLS